MVLAFIDNCKQYINNILIYLIDLSYSIMGICLEKEKETKVEDFRADTNTDIPTNAE